MSITFDIGEQPLSALQLRSEKGQANGYAGLDATGKVPLAQLPAGLGQIETSALQLRSEVMQTDGNPVIALAVGSVIKAVYWNGVRLSERVYSVVADTLSIMVDAQIGDEFIYEYTIS